MFKKIIGIVSTLAALALVFAFAACGQPVGADGSNGLPASPPTPFDGYVMNVNPDDITIGQGDSTDIDIKVLRYGADVSDRTKITLLKSLSASSTITMTDNSHARLVIGSAEPTGTYTIAVSDSRTTTVKIVSVAVETP